MNHRPDSHHHSTGDLAARLRSHAATIDVAGRSADHVVARGRRLQQRRRTAVGVAAVVGIAGGTITTINVLDGGPAGTVTGSAPPATDASTPGGPTPGGPSTTPLQLVPSDLVWNVVEPGSAEALGMTNLSDAGIVGDGPYLAWSTAPGRTDTYTPTLWRSDDGQRWTVVPEPPAVSSTTLTADGDRFIAFGTTPARATAPEGVAVEAALSASDDGGSSWRPLDLPVDVDALAADPVVERVTTLPQAIAAGPLGVVAAVRVQATLDWEALLPAGSVQRGIETRADGVVVHGTGECGSYPTVPTTIVVSSGGEIVVPASTPDTLPPSAATSTQPPTTEEATGDTVPVSSTCTEAPVPTEFRSWADLGVSPATAAAATGEIRYYVAPDGETFEPAAGPADEPGLVTAEVRLAATPDGFAAWTRHHDAQGNVQSRVALSSDSRSWTDAGPSPIAFVQSMAAFGDRLVLTGSTGMAEGTFVAVRDAAGTWTTTDLSAVLTPDDGVLPRLFLTKAAIGPAGITISGSVFRDPVAEVGGVEVSRDGFTLRAADSSGSSFVVTGPDGTEVGSMRNGVQAGLVSSAPDGTSIVVRLEDGGDVVARFTWDEIYTAISGASAGPIEPDGLVLHSADGTTWSREALDDIAGESVRNSGARVVGNQVVVAVTRTATDNGAGIPEQLLLVGTRQG